MRAAGVQRPTQRAKISRSDYDPRQMHHTDVADSQGSFLTKTIFPDPAAAVNGLYLGPYGNNASLMQPVTATGRSIILEGGIANGTPGVQQSLIVNRGAFQFGTGLGY